MNRWFSVLLNTQYVKGKLKITFINQVVCVTLAYSLFHVKAN